MRKAGGGSIISTSSVASFLPSTYGAAYDLAAGARLLSDFLQQLLGCGFEATERFLLQPSRDRLDHQRRPQSRCRSGAEQIPPSFPELLGSHLFELFQLLFEAVRRFPCL